MINDLIKNRRFNLKATDRKSGSFSYSVRLDTCPPFSSSLPPSTPPQASSPPLSQISTYNKFDSAAFSALTVRSSTSNTSTSSISSSGGDSSSGRLPPSPSLGLLFSSPHLHSLIVFFYLVRVASPAGYEDFYVSVGFCSLPPTCCCFSF